MEAEVRNAVIEASRRDDVRRTVETVYSTLADEIAIRRPICKTSGRCCRFEEFGHRLYVTTIEMAKFYADIQDLRRGAAIAKSERRAESPGHSLTLLSHHSAAINSSEGGGCPFQIDGLCGVHSARPFGCRIFFCDETSTIWQQELYERLHGRLRQLHESLNVPYFYLEWRFALGALGLNSF